jgi:hypothetical protein
MTEQSNAARLCRRCAYWDRGLCRHGMATERERHGCGRCPFFSRDVSAFAFFVKEWRW